MLIKIILRVIGSFVNIVFQVSIIPKLGGVAYLNLYQMEIAFFPAFNVPRFIVVTHSENSCKALVCSSIYFRYHIRIYYIYCLYHKFYFKNLKFNKIECNFKI